MNKWQKIKHYVNSHPVGTIINRMDMRCYINGKHVPWYGNYSTTEDNYRRILTMLGILEWVERGKYKILHHVKKDLSSRQAKSAAYGDSWKSWFIDVKA